MNPEATITVVEPGTQAMKHYQVLDPNECLAEGDCCIASFTQNNTLAVHDIYYSWVGRQVQDCPTGIYLRPVAPPEPDNSETSQCTVCGRKAYGDWYHHRECSSAFQMAGSNLNRCKGIMKPL